MINFRRIKLRSTIHLPMAEELKEKHGLTDKDIHKILSRTFLVWGH